ncbi:MAG: HAMP domain-containing protein [Pseudomonadota bacterium]|nr:MAG: HAMP domain-containing protein [Pseudomonadota bacterium]
MAYKLAIVITLLISTSMVLLGLVIVKNQTTLLTAQMDSFGAAVTHQLAESSEELVLSDDLLGLMVLINNLGKTDELLGAAVYSETGVVLASTGLIPAYGVETPRQDQQGSADGAYTQEWLVNRYPLEAQNVVSFVRPIEFQGLTAGYALVTFSKASLAQAVTDTIRAVVAATVLMILLGIVTAYFIGKRLTRPIHRLMRASKAIDQGDYAFRISERRNDEIGYLIEAFNTMADGLLEKTQVENVFSRFVSPNVARQIMENLDHVRLGGEHVNGSVLFADIVGFTSMSEKLPPQEIADLLNEYFTHIAMASRLYRGTIDKFMGDCAMIVFGIPEQDEDHKFNAIACAVMIQRLIERLNTTRQRDGKFPVHFRIGVNSGEMLAGNMGSHDRMQYTVVGDAVNLAARLHNVAVGDQIAITEFLYRDADVHERVNARRHELIKLRGKSEPVTTYIVEGVASSYTRTMNAHIDKLLAQDVVA